MAVTDCNYGQGMGGNNHYFEVVYSGQGSYYSLMAHTDDATITGQAHYYAVETSSWSVTFQRAFKGKMSMGFGQRGGSATLPHVTIGSTDYTYNQSTPTVQYMEWDVDIASGTTVTFYAGTSSNGWATTFLFLEQ